jgi:hypothetical protein
MAVTTTAFNDLLARLRSDFPGLTFTQGDTFHWSPDEKTVYYPPNYAENAPQLLHEAAHGVLGHRQYENDLGLIKLEREAWNKATALGASYGISFDPEEIEDALDSYREWLHARSTCPRCHQNGLQTTPDTYACLICDQQWHVNDARTCGLKRTKI